MHALLTWGPLSSSAAPIVQCNHLSRSGGLFQRVKSALTHTNFHLLPHTMHKMTSTIAREKQDPRAGNAVYSFFPLHLSRNGDTEVTHCGGNKTGWTPRCPNVSARAERNVEAGDLRHGRDSRSGTEMPSLGATERPAFTASLGHDG
jgi:hypothetical protein